MKRVNFCLCLLFLVPLTRSAANWKFPTENPEYIHRSVKLMTDVIVHDIYSPPVASRIYAYITVAGYEASVPAYPSYRSFALQLRDLQPLPQPEAGTTYCHSLASTQAILLVGKTMVISEQQVEEFRIKILKEFQQTGMPKSIYENSIAYGILIADHILKWASKDNYKETRSFARYSVEDDTASWKPTPPAYFKAVEPHWSKIRPMIIDSAQQFKPAPATKFSADTSSLFYKEAFRVYKSGTRLTQLQKEIANFWDCNPFKMNIRGHVMFATKKISPGGHWININRLACKKNRATVIKSLEAYACLSVALFDAFISCWDEKYRSNVIRPETYINQYIDPYWVPLLQTPPFPEYTSGHSVVSSAASIVLTKIFGENFSYADATELEFGLPVRNFKSFKQAAEEAALSRFYGGIHYMPSITLGFKEGTDIGNFIVRRLNTRRHSTAATR